jgi:hypothetical protein
MNVIVAIGCREAIPVRASPLLTDWQGMTPDVCAKVFAGDAPTAPRLEGLPTYRLKDSNAFERVRPRYWENWIVPRMAACSARIKAAQPIDELGYQQWQHESLMELPAGIFVWRDEFETAHLREYGPRVRPYAGDAYALDFNPEHGPCEDWPALVMEGFEQMALPTAQSQVAPETLQSGKTHAAAADGTSKGEEAWRSMAQKRAIEIIARQKTKDLYPSQVDIADEIAREFRASGVVGKDGKPLSGAYIKRHALGGISSAEGKRLSTSIREGK